MPNTANAIVKELQSLGTPEGAEGVRRYFKTGKGEYGEGDEFIGIKVPVLRDVAKRHEDLAIAEIEKLLHSPLHEARAVALMILIRSYQKGDQDLKETLFDLYLRNTRYVNNWDLVDLSAPHIVGAHLGPGKHALLTKLAQSELLWERRIAIIATQSFIRRDYYDETLRVSELLLKDSHDLIHKAVGWMLREVGNRDRAVEEVFLRDHAAQMPRTMLRYAIEKFPPKLWERYMEMKNAGGSPARFR
jgi:3-methyladenine DNA glycosylase AlkD